MKELHIKYLKRSNYLQHLGIQFMCFKQQRFTSTSTRSKGSLRERKHRGRVRGYHQRGPRKPASTSSPCRPLPPRLLGAVVVAFASTRAVIGPLDSSCFVVLYIYLDILCLGISGGGDSVISVDQGKEGDRK